MTNNERNNMVEIILHPAAETWAALCQRAVFDDSLIEGRVGSILQRVKEGGDEALRAITTEIDGTCPADFKVSEAEFKKAESLVPDELKAAIRRAKGNIERFHQAELSAPIEVKTMAGVTCQRRQLPVSRVGLYIPGGSAPLFSTVLMLAVPAAIAGCPEVILCTPSAKDGSVNPVVLWTARLCGVSTIYKLGGAQAIGAMAYGTESIRKVNKIFGPGNRYVTKAKQIVSAQGTAIDMPAGPSEIMVIADETARPSFIAADMLSQAEHGPDSQAMVVCPTKQMADAINVELERQLALLPRATVADRALTNSRIIVIDNRDEAVRFANTYAPEHLLIETASPWDIAQQITAAGSVFIGHYSPESAGDYASGTNHTLPTMGLATAYSGVGVDSFMHAITFQELTTDGINDLSGTIISMAEAEGLKAHANAVRVRLAEESGAEEKASVQSKTDVLTFVRPNIASLAPYSTARDEYKGTLGNLLDANENPFDTGCNRYPGTALRERVRSMAARLKGISPDHLFLGNGSDEAIDLCYRIFCTPGKDNAIGISPSYGMYSVCAAINDVAYRPVPLNADFSLPVDSLLAAADDRSRLLFLCSPNNPTSNAFPTEQLIEVITRFNGIVVVDEAYTDFSSEPSLLTRLDEFPNLIVLQTFSKAYGLAGLRIGMAFASPAIIRIFRQVKYPYNIGTDTLELAEKLLVRDISTELDTVKRERARVSQALAAMPCITHVYPSDANFLLVKVTRARALYDALLQGGIIVRDRSTVAGCLNCLRITIGTPEENDRMISIVSSFPA